LSSRTFLSYEIFCQYDSYEQEQLKGLRNSKEESLAAEGRAKAALQEDLSRTQVSQNPYVYIYIYE